MVLKKWGRLRSGDVSKELVSCTSECLGSRTTDQTRVA